MIVVVEVAVVVTVVVAVVGAVVIVAPVVIVLVIYLVNGRGRVCGMGLFRLLLPSIMPVATSLQIRKIMVTTTNLTTTNLP